MAKKGKFQIRAEYAAVRAVLGALGLLPRRVSLAVCFVLTRLGYYAIGGLRRVGMRNLEIAFPEMPDDERRRILKGTFENIGRVLGEVSQMHKMTPERLAKIVDFNLDAQSLDLYAKNKATGRGVLIVTGHFGNWELMVLGFAAIHEPMAYLARPLDNPLIEDLTVRMRTRYGNRPINKTNSAMICIRELREGGILGILADVNAHPKEGVFVPFFGVPACTTSGAAMIAIRSNAWIYPTFCAWDKAAGKYKLVHGKLIEPANTGDRKADIVTTTAEYTAEIEKVIRQYPEQWMWIHKRWKTRPPGEGDIYGRKR
ncbi:MAG: lysophospholipid acyltransferase family protein [Pyrinomonadaceae bacterium]|nr:lysophospholipid acyltransferase family protein [Pyrinomonadaceae bacterium]MBP6213580.1 lysophospholipid acyltransferase family protein [Pyrinomonadaceae bacterium]